MFVVLWRPISRLEPIDKSNIVYNMTTNVVAILVIIDFHVYIHTSTIQVTKFGAIAVFIFGKPIFKVNSSVIPVWKTQLDQDCETSFEQKHDSFLMVFFVTLYAKDPQGKSKLSELSLNVRVVSCTSN